MTKEFMQRRISKEVINLGIGGQIERGGDELPPRSTVRFQAEATVSSIKHKFLEDGTVEEMTVLTVVADSFEVLGVEPAIEQPELPLAGVKLADTPESIAATDEVIARMNLRKSDGTEAGAEAPLLVSCEACGHLQESHEGGQGTCLNQPCTCAGYVAFASVETEPAEVQS